MADVSELETSFSTARSGPPRIALVSDWFLPRLGGIETHLAGLAEALAAAGCAPEILTTIPGPSLSGATPVRRLAARLDPIFHLALSPSLRDELRRALQRGAYDLVHVHVSVIAPVALAALLAARDLGLPCHVTFHSVLAKFGPALRLADRLFGWSEGLSLSAVSDLVANQVRLAFPGSPVGILPNGIDLDFWMATRPRARCDPDEIVAVSAMRLNWKKRPLVLLAAFEAAAADVRRAGRRLRLKIAGAGGERARMDAFVRRSRFRENIELLGALSPTELRAHYEQADLFLLASIEEAFGIAALEARVAGLPVVTMAESGARAFLEHGRNALLAGSDREFAAHIRTLALDDDLRLRLASPDPRLARFAWPQIAATHLDVYRAAGGIGSASGEGGREGPRSGK